MAVQLVLQQVIEFPFSGGETVWSAVHNVEPRVKMDFHQIEELFCQRSAAPAPSKAGKKAESVQNAPVHPVSINLLDSKRSLAVNIFLKQFRSGADGVLDAVKSGDASKLGAERLQGLQKLLPDKTEVIDQNFIIHIFSCIDDLL